MQTLQMSLVPHPVLTLLNIHSTNFREKKNNPVYTKISAMDTVSIDTDSGQNTFYSSVKYYKLK